MEACDKSTGAENIRLDLGSLAYRIADALKASQHSRCSGGTSRHCSTIAESTFTLLICTPGLNRRSQRQPPFAM